MLTNGSFRNSSCYVGRFTPDAAGPDDVRPTRHGFTRPGVNIRNNFLLKAVFELSEILRVWSFLPVFIVAAMSAHAAPATPGSVNPSVCANSAVRTMHADVIAFDQPMMINRLGSTRPQSMIYALRRDVVAIDPTKPLGPGNAQLRADKRPRPLVLRVNKNECLKIDFTNYLTPAPASPQQPVTRAASIHVTGMELVKSIADDGFNAGANPDAQVPSGGHTTYSLFAAEEGTFLLYSPAGSFNGFGSTQQMLGLFGAVTVEPVGAEWYRSQVSHADFVVAAGDAPPNVKSLPPKIDYDVRYPAGPKKGQPVLRMNDGTEIVASDLTALITGPNHGRFSAGSRPTPNPSLLPDREAPFREVTSIYAESQDLVQAFADYLVAGTNLTANGGGDGFAINYGASGIVNEILANRLKIGPAADCPDCKFEEFFLSSWPNGDPGEIVDIPSNVNCVADNLMGLTENTASTVVGVVTEKCNLGELPTIKPTKAFYPDDPSNVYHAYLGDHTIFRILHAGVSVHHVHHHHAHQWLFSPDAPGSNYLDSQSIGPGSSFSLELVYNGAGNQNLTAGDSIFHCHFYPHFASGMWALFRVHDVLEIGTPLDADGRPLPHSRALPDPEIATGTPIPAVVPLPTLAEAPYPAAVEIAQGQTHFPAAPTANPGYPFFVPGLAGHRAPHPPMAFAREGGQTLDGGLPRHLILGAHVSAEVHSQTDYTKNLDTIDAVLLPEKGTPVEQLAMTAHATRKHPSSTPEGRKADFLETGMPARAGAPFANPLPIGFTDKVRVYKGADVQLDAVFNKAGWHYPQERMMALWGDVAPMVVGTKPPEPLFFRANAGEAVEYWQSNLVPSYMELDDFQVRTPTDIIGQHIHLVKFDVMAADGAANGFNYEDGAFSAQEVRDRIAAIQAKGGLCVNKGTDSGLLRCSPGATRLQLKAKAIPELGSGPQGDYVGAQATMRVWYIDPLTDTTPNRSFMTVFTHDHFSASSHQEVGLYGGLLIEPPGSVWSSPDGKTTLGNGRYDGGPTSYAANIAPGGGQPGYREFGIAWADTQFAYNATSQPLPICYPGQSRPACTAPTGAPVTTTGSLQYGSLTIAVTSPTNILVGQSVSGSGIPPAATVMSIAANNVVISQPAARTSAAVSLTFTPGYSGWTDTTYTTTSSGTQTNTHAIAPAASGLGLQPLVIGDFGSGTFVMNYRNEPVPLRLATLNATNPNNASATNNAGTAGDASWAYASIDGRGGGFSAQPTPMGPIDSNCTGTPCFQYPANPIALDMQPGDPYTPLLRAYPGDPVQLRLLSGGFTTMHDVMTHGLPWKFEAFNPNSGWRESQFQVLSEHFEVLATVPRQGDYLYSTSASLEGTSNGLWGLLRAYGRPQETLAPLALNQNMASVPFVLPKLPAACDQGQPCLRKFAVTALTIQQLTGTGSVLTYNSRGLPLSQGVAAKEQLNDPNAIVFVNNDDLCNSGETDCMSGGLLKAGRSIEPLALRAAAGDVIELTLTNLLSGPANTLPTISAARTSMPYTSAFGEIQLQPSNSVGIHPQLLAVDVRDGDGANVGANPDTTVLPTPAGVLNPNQRTYHWYAGTITAGPSGPVATPVEFGAVNLQSSDPLNHAYRGLFGGLIVEPKGSTWVDDPTDHSSATVFTAGGTVFRDFIVNGQDDADIQLNGQSNYQAGNALSAINYRTEPAIYRYGQSLTSVIPTAATAVCAASPASQWDWTNLTECNLTSLAGLQWSTLDTSAYLSNSLVGADPQTPIYRAPAGMPVRFRLLHAQGNGDNQQVFEISGHTWQAEPYTDNSSAIGDNQRSTYQGVQSGYGVTSHYDAVIPSAGGANKIPGDYVYRTWVADQFQVGFWGLFRVAPSDTSAMGGPSVTPLPLADTIAITGVTSAGSGNGIRVSGYVTVRPIPGSGPGVTTNSVALNDGTQSTNVSVGADGLWAATVPGSPARLRVTSPFGGTATWVAPGAPLNQVAAVSSQLRLVAHRSALLNHRKPAPAGANP